MTDKQVTSPAGHEVTVVDAETIKHTLNLNDKSFGQVTRLSRDRRAIVETLWFDGPVEAANGFATAVLAERAVNYGFRNAGNVNAATAIIRSQIMDLCLTRQIKGKRTYRIALTTIPYVWYDHLLKASRKIETVKTPEPEPSALCERCRRPFAQHLVFHDKPEPSTLATLTEASFPATPTTGVYCPTEPVIVNNLVAEPKIESELHPLERNLADAVATALLARVIEVLTTGKSDVVGLRLRQLRDEVDELQKRLGQQVEYVSNLRRQVREAGDEIITLKFERDGLRQRLRTAEHNLTVATSGDAKRIIENELHKEIDRLMRQTPGPTNKE